MLSTTSSELYKETEESGEATVTLSWFLQPSATPNLKNGNHKLPLGWNQAFCRSRHGFGLFLCKLCHLGIFDLQEPQRGAGSCAEHHAPWPFEREVKDVGVQREDGSLALRACNNHGYATCTIPKGLTSPGSEDQGRLLQALVESN